MRTASMATNFFLKDLQEHLRTVSGVDSVTVQYGNQATPSQLALWEQDNCPLPHDLKQFYLAHDGVTLSWSYALNGTSMEIGKIAVNSLSSLRPVSLLDLPPEHSPSDGEWRPSCSSSCLLRSLNYCSSCGHTCLVTRTDTSESSIWLLDHGLSFHKLASSFTAYLRLAIVHWGITQWPFALKRSYLSPEHKSWLELFVPERLAVDTQQGDNPVNILQ